MKWNHSILRLSQTDISKSLELTERRPWIWQSLQEDIPLHIRHLVSMSGKKKDVMPVSELLKLTRQKNEFSQYRERLRDKGLIDISERGLIKFVLPGFDKFVENEMVKNDFYDF